MKDLEAQRPPRKELAGEAIGHPQRDSFDSRLGLIGLKQLTPAGAGVKGDTDDKDGRRSSGRFWRLAHTPTAEGGKGQEFRHEGSRQQEDGGEEGETGFGRSLNGTHHHDQGCECHHKEQGVDPECQPAESSQTVAANETGENEKQICQQERPVQKGHFCFPQHNTHEHRKMDTEGRQP